MGSGPAPELHFHKVSLAFWHSNCVSIEAQYSWRFYACVCLSRKKNKRSWDLSQVLPSLKLKMSARLELSGFLPCSQIYLDFWTNETNPPLYPSRGCEELHIKVFIASPAFVPQPNRLVLLLPKPTWTTPAGPGWISADHFHLATQVYTEEPAQHVGWLVDDGQHRLWQKCRDN